jgi:hypothetical protein
VWGVGFALRHSMFFSRFTVPKIRKKEGLRYETVHESKSRGKKEKESGREHLYSTQTQLTYSSTLSRELELATTR